MRITEITLLFFLLLDLLLINKHLYNFEKKFVNIYTGFMYVLILPQIALKIIIKINNDNNLNLSKEELNLNYIQQMNSNIRRMEPLQVISALRIVISLLVVNLN